MRTIVTFYHPGLRFPNPLPSMVSTINFADDDFEKCSTEFAKRELTQQHEVLTFDLKRVLVLRSNSTTEYDLRAAKLRFIFHTITEFFCVRSAAIW